MDRGAWQAVVHGVTNSWIPLSNFHFHTRCIESWAKPTKNSYILSSSTPLPQFPCYYHLAFMWHIYSSWSIIINWSLTMLPFHSWFQAEGSAPSGEGCFRNREKRVGRSKKRLLELLLRTGIVTFPSRWLAQTCCWWAGKSAPPLGSYRNVVASRDV